MDKQINQELTFGPSEIPRREITIHNCLGKGNFGAVYRAYCRGHEVAVKIPHSINISKEVLKNFKDEVTIMSKNTHPNIIRFMGTCTENNELLIITEICKGGDLKTLLNNHGYKVSLFERLQMARDIVKGMLWLQANNIIHGDLKPANLLIDHLGQVKIADFGFSELKKSVPPENVRGSPLWLAPEKSFKKMATEKSDVFSFGIILWEIVTRKKPYYHKNYVDANSLLEDVCHNDERPLLTADIPEGLQNLMKACWHKDPAKRYTFDEILYRLNSIMIYNVIEAPLGADFWASNFITEDKVEIVEWNVFRTKLQKSLDFYDDAFFDHLKTCLVEDITGVKYQEIVTMANFNTAVIWFGKFFMRESGYTIIQALNQLYEFAWFHGNIGREIANSRLSGQPKGTFLIRLSAESSKFPFCLSLVKNVHLQIKRIAAGYVLPALQDDVYESLEELVQRNSLVCVIPCSKVQGIRYPDVAFEELKL